MILEITPITKRNFSAILRPHALRFPRSEGPPASSSVSRANPFDKMFAVAGARCLQSRAHATKGYVAQITGLRMGATQPMHPNRDSDDTTTPKISLASVAGNIVLQLRATRKKQRRCNRTSRQIRSPITRHHGGWVRGLHEIPAKSRTRTN